MGPGVGERGQPCHCRLELGDAVHRCLCLQVGRNEGKVWLQRTTHGCLECIFVEPGQRPGELMHSSSPLSARACWLFLRAQHGPTFFPFTYYPLIPCVSPSLRQSNACVYILSACQVALLVLKPCLGCSPPKRSDRSADPQGPGAALNSFRALHHFLSPLLSPLRSYLEMLCDRCRVNKTLSV